MSRLGPVGLLVICVVYGVEALQIPLLPIDAGEAMSARTLPIIYAAAGAVLSLLLIARRSAPVDVGAVTRSGFVRAGGIALLAAGYALVLPWSGFVLTTGVFLALSFLQQGIRGFAGLVVLPATVTGLLWLLLSVVLGVHLPAGPL